MINTLSGAGTHTLIFSPSPSVQLRLRYTPQSTGTHGRVWRAAGHAASACANEWAGIRVTGARVVEVGCGCGGTGLACAALGASLVWLSDVDDKALAQAAENVALNGLGAPAVEVRRLDVEQAVSHEWPRFDVVLCADAPFDFVTPSRLVAALARLLAPTAGARALLVQDGDPRRSEAHRRGIAECIRLAESHPTLRCVAREERAVAAARHDADGEAGADTHVVLLHAFARRDDADASDGDGDGGPEE